MSWFKIDDNSTFHPKIIQAGNEAWGAFCRMGAYSSAHLTEGFIPAAIALTIAPKKVLAKLIECRLLDASPEGYCIHDYLKYNPSAAEVQSKREARSEAGRKGGLNSSQAKQQAKGQAIASANTQSKINPDPTRPLPSVLSEHKDARRGVQESGEDTDPYDPTGGRVYGNPASEKQRKELIRLGYEGTPPASSKEISAMITALRSVADKPPPPPIDPKLEKKIYHELKHDWAAELEAKQRARELANAAA